MWLGVIVGRSLLPSGNRDISSRLLYHQPKPQANGNEMPLAHKYEAKAFLLPPSWCRSGGIACSVGQRDMSLLELMWDYLV